MMDGVAGGYLVWLNPLYCCRLLVNFYYDQLQVAGKMYNIYTLGNCYMHVDTVARGGINLMAVAGYINIVGYVCT